MSEIAFRSLKVHQGFIIEKVIYDDGEIFWSIKGKPRYPMKDLFKELGVEVLE